MSEIQVASEYKTLPLDEQRLISLRTRIDSVLGSPGDENRIGFRYISYADRKLTYNTHEEVSASYITEEKHPISFSVTRQANGTLLLAYRNDTRSEGDIYSLDASIFPTPLKGDLNPYMTDLQIERRGYKRDGYTGKAIGDPLYQFLMGQVTLLEEGLAQAREFIAPTIDRLLILRTLKAAAEFHPADTVFARGLLEDFFPGFNLRFPDNFLPSLEKLLVYYGRQIEMPDELSAEQRQRIRVLFGKFKQALGEKAADVAFLGHKQDLQNDEDAAFAEVAKTVDMWRVGRV